MAVVPLPAPISDNAFPITTSSLYVPTATLTVSLGEAAAMAALILEKHPAVPPGFTHRVAATADGHIPMAAASESVMNPFRAAAGIPFELSMFMLTLSSSWASSYMADRSVSRKGGFCLVVGLN